MHGSAALGIVVLDLVYKDTSTNGHDSRHLQKNHLIFI